MEKLNMRSIDFTKENIAKLAELFPNCVTETADDEGNPRKSIDFDLLRQELSDDVVSGLSERYRIDWPGKLEALLNANTPTTKTLRPCREESVDFDTTKNIFIEGDNLEVLKLLQETYLSKVKMIYIDPPYNTGNDFIYKDKFYESVEEYQLNSEQKDEEGNRLVPNTESCGRFHSNWLSMMYPRLKLARNLLRDDGVIFISIDDNEQANLKKMCEEVFGEENFISELIWKSGRTAAAHFTNEHEYILCFGKSKSSLPLFEYNGKGSISERAIKRPTAMNPISAIKFPAGVDFESEDKVFKSSLGKEEPIRIVEGVFKAKNGKLANDVTIEAAWTMRNMIISWLSGDSVYDQKGQKVKRFFFKSNGVLYYEKERKTIHPKSIIEGYATRLGRNDNTDLFGTNFFDFPKPQKLISSLINVVVKDKDIILDFFAGSSTTAHATMQLNAEDGESRKFIMVQLPEPCAKKSEAHKAGYKSIAEISKERIRRAGKKIREENATTAPDLDIGFRVFKVDSSNMEDVYYKPADVERLKLFDLTENIKPDRSPEDLLLQVLLDWGVDLTLPITTETIKGLEVFFVDEDVLAACFAPGGQITEEFCQELACRKPRRVAFRDAGFENDDVKINAGQILKQLSPTTDLRTL